MVCHRSEYWPCEAVCRVTVPGFVAVLVAEMDFHAGNVLRQVAESAGRVSFSLLGPRFAAGQVIVGIDLNVHDSLVVVVPGRFGGWRLYGPGEGFGGPGLRPGASGLWV